MPLFSIAHRNSKVFINIMPADGDEQDISVRHPLENYPVIAG
jgi:hypothetical protein